MKRKFFFTSFLFIISIAITAVLVTGFYFAQEREYLIDQQIEAIASGLLANELKDAELTQMDDIIADALFDQPRTILINIYNKDKKIIYQNLNSQNILGDETPPLDQKLFTYKSDDHTIRFFNFPLSPKKMLQLGLLLDQQELQRWAMNKRIIVLMGLILAIVMIWAWIQARILVRPLEEVTFYINSLGSNVEKNAPTPTIPPTLQKMMAGKKDKEIQLLWDSLNYFRNAVETKIKLTKTTVAQMAHELKTPLTIIKNSFEFLQTKLSPEEELQRKMIKGAIEETDRLSATISSFLAWSRFESIDDKKEIHALKISTLIEEIVNSINKAYPEQKYTIDAKDSFQVFANPEDLRQLLRNLIQNAFKYNSAETIAIYLEGETLTIENESLPVPEKVFERLGEPFNAGKIDGNKSIGLGLAWVSSICKRYQWSFHFQYENGKTHCSISFAS